MTVASDVNKHVYAGNGLTRVWPYTFPLYDAAHLQVYVKRGEADPVLLERGYVLNEAARTVTYPPEGTGEAPLPKGDQIVILRVVPELQLMDLLNHGEFFAEDIEREFDLIVMMIQQLAEALSRAVVGPVDQTDSGVAYKTLIEAMEAARKARDEAKAAVAEALGKMEAAVGEGKKYAEEARKHAQDYIPYSFGRFRVENGDLVADYYGDPDGDDIKFDDEGNVILYVRDAPKVNLGRGRICFKREEYDESTAYEFYDCVKYGGEWWLHTGAEETVGTAPEESDIWTLFGAQGNAASVRVGEVETGPAGSEAVVVNEGTANAAVLRFTIPRGDKGDAATVAVGEVKTGAEGTDVSVTNEGTEYAARLNFTIPRGYKGDAATIRVGSVATGKPGSDAAVSNEGTEHAAVFNFTIPRGDKGEKGEKGDAGKDFVIRGHYATIDELQEALSSEVDDVPPPEVGDTYSIGAEVPYDLYIWDGKVWENHGKLQGPQGEPGEPGAHGNDGAAATVKVGKVTTGVAGTEVIVKNTGTESAAVLDFTIPRGERGEKGEKGEKGDAGPQGAKGVQGERGAAGASVTAATINASGILVLTTN